VLALAETIRLMGEVDAVSLRQVSKLVLV